MKGKRQPILRQLADISWSAMNHGDTFILDVRSHIFVWTGKDSNRMERLQASKVDLVPNFHVTLLRGEYHAWLYCACGLNLDKQLI